MSTAAKTPATMWAIEMEGGERFTLTADNKDEAKEKALRFRRDDKVKSVKNVADMIAAEKYK